MKFLLRDGKAKLGARFRRLICGGGVRPVALPDRSPSLHFLVERWIRTAQDECVGKLTHFGKKSYARALGTLVEYFHAGRNHQSTRYLIPTPRAEDSDSSGRGGSSEGRASADYFTSIFIEKDEYVDHTPVLPRTRGFDNDLDSAKP